MISQEKAKKQDNRKKFDKKPSIVDSTGYVSLQKRIQYLQDAGTMLNVARSEMFDFDPKEGDEEFNIDDYQLNTNLLRGLPVDLADVSQEQRENAARLEEVKSRLAEYKRSKARAKALREASEAAETASEKKEEVKPQKEKKEAE